MFYFLGDIKFRNSLPLVQVNVIYEYFVLNTK